MQNFRGFKDVTIDFASNLAVFIGVNGSGKSSIIDCLDNLLFELIRPLLPVTRNTKSIGIYGDKSFKENDISNGSQETINELTFFCPEFSQEFSRDIKLLYCFAYPSSSEEPRKDFERSKLEDVENFKHFIHSQIHNKPNQNIPIVACYSTKRGVTSSYEVTGIDLMSLPNIASLSQLHCYTDATNQAEIHFNTFFLEKNLLVMVADIARRLAIANPDPTKNALEGEGIILIDEIELHLHPQWQRDIIPRLTSTFPNCQFIVTTHSPQVLSNVKKENVFIVEDFQVYPADAYTFGRDSNSILSELMGVTERPVKIQNKLTECLYKIDDGQIEEAKILLHELSDLLGHNDSEIVKANTLISFLSKVK